MTPKEQYEARKAARREKRMDENAKDAEMIDMVDRFVTAVERIADILERPQVPASLNPVFDPNSASRIINTFGK